MMKNKILMLSVVMVVALAAGSFLLYAKKVESVDFPLIRQNDQSVAIDGYSPVSYFQRNKAELGRAEFQTDVNGVLYYFTDQEQLDMFSKEPQKYLPAHGGWCSLMLSGSGNLTPANPESFKVIDDKLLLFWDGQFKGQRVNGLKNWTSKTKGEAKKESKRLKDANKAWAKINATKMSATIVIFDESDKRRLNQAQLKSAKKHY